MTPLVSAVIPCFNAEKTLRETIESALCQTYQHLEVIVVDDGSIDASVDIARSFGERIRLIQKKNGGPASARNVGIRESQGEFVAFLDADDTWLPFKTERQVQAFLDHAPVGLVHSDYLRLEDDRIVGTSKKINLAQCQPRRIFREIFRGDILIGTVSVMARRTMIEEVGYFDERPEIQGAEDYDLWLRIADCADVFYIPEFLAQYRVSFSGHNRFNISRAYSSSRLVRSKHETLFRNKYSGTDKELLMLRANSAFREGLSYFHLHDHVHAQKKFWEAVMICPWNFKSLLYFFLSLAKPSIVNRARRNKILVVVKRFLSEKGN